jgi:hypothetical protein
MGPIVVVEVLPLGEAVLQVDVPFVAGQLVELLLVGPMRALDLAIELGSVRAERRLDDYFDVVLVSFEVGVTKPDPRIYALCLSRLGLAAPSALFVDDRPENVEGARLLGIETVLFRGDRVWTRSGGGPRSESTARRGPSPVPPVHTCAATAHSCDRQLT